MWNHRKRRLATSRASPRHEGQVAISYHNICLVCPQRASSTDTAMGTIDTQQNEHASKVKMSLCNRDEE